MSQPSRFAFTAQIFLVVLLITLTSVTTLAQGTSQYDRGTPPQHAAGVASFGSYISSDIGTVNLSNGSLNMAIPLGTAGGRGFSIPITLNYSSKVWSVSKDTDYVDGTSTVAYASYGAGDFLQGYHNRLSAGWTVGIAPWITSRSFGIDPLAHPGCGFNRYLTKLTVTLPDKGEIELRDDYADGAPHLATTKPPTGNCRWYDAYRGRRWHASDGSGIIFISDVDNAVVNGDLAGVLVTADGMRYRFVNASSGPAGVVLGRATSITDRNGNIIGITYPNTNEVNYTDQLNRVTKIKKNVPDPQNGQPLDLLVEIPGYSGSTRFYKVKSGVMNQNYRTGINPSLPVINGAYNPQNYFFDNQWWAGGTTLFDQSYCLFIERLDEQPVVNELILPDNRSIQFKYNQYGEVAEVQLPTGGKIQYDYNITSALPTGVSLPAEVQTWTIPINISTIDRAIVARRTYPDGVNLEGSWTYNYTATNAEARAFTDTGTLLRNEKHYFMTASRYLTPHGDGTNGTGYSLWSTGLENRSEIRNAANAVISATESDWTQRASVSWWTGYTQQQPANDNRVNQTRRYLETGQMAKVETFYDQYNNPTEVKEYDFDQTLKRRTVTSYISTNNGFNYQTDDAIHLLSLPATATVFNGAGTQVAQSTNEYDVYTGDGNHALLTGYGSVSQHDSTNYGTSKTTRGNITRIGQWLNTSGTFVYTYPRFDVVGNVVSTKDALGNVTTFSFSDDFGLGQNPGTPTQNPATPTYAFPTLITSPPPLPGAPVHTARSQYDYSSGLLTGFRDRNNTVTQTIYNDPFNRPTQVKAALGVATDETHVTTYYAPATVFGITLAKNDVLTATDLNTVDDASIKSWTVTDGFGRTTETWKDDPEGDVKVITRYDCLNRVKQTSNPFRPSSETAVYTSTVYDLAGRVTSVTTPDNAAVNTSYSGNTITVTDQAGKARKSVTDALGRLIEVYEDPSGLNYQTTYNYDTLDNLVKVTQGTQQRFFMYDSLKRLIRSRNPEQSTNASLNLSDPITGNSAWSTGYQYDANNNLTQKTDPRGVVSVYAYDAFNRNTTVDYSDTASINPDVKRFYDGATNGKGRFWYFYTGGDFSTGSNVDHTSVDSYDALGRPLVQRQLFKLNGAWGPTYQISRAPYNRNSGVTSQTYPSGRSVTYNYDTAGRVADKDPSNPAFKGNLGDGVQRTYAKGISYSPRDSLRREQYGTSTAVYHKLRYNIRNQLCDVRASNVNDDWGGELGAFVNHYSTSWTHCGSGTDNNGNLLMSQTIINSYYMEDRYSYDALNRLTAVNEWQNGATHTGSQQYTYDRWGNRTINPVSWGTGINTKQFTVDSNTNRLGVPGGQPGVMGYDAAGNLTNDTYSSFGSRTYDAENKMTSAQDSFAGSSYYTYNADGHRTRRKIRNEETWQVYGFDGELLAEYPASGPINQPQKEYGYRNGQLLVVAAMDTVWSDDAVPAGAATAGDNEGWNWISSNPAPFSGSSAHQSNIVAGLHQHYFYGATSTLNVNPGDRLFTYVYLDPANMPSQIMLQWAEGGSWEHRAYWGANNLPWGVDGTNSRRNMGPLPAAGTWVRLEVPANLVGLEGKTLHGMAFSMWGGRATWDRAGKSTSPPVSWLVTDHLGTPRIVIDQTGTLANIKRHDYLPFGEELFAGVGGRSTALGYTGGDGIRQQFTEKERDVETGLDYFLARYYSSTQGRFTGVDPFNIALETQKAAELNPEKARVLFNAYLSQPQQWNRYSYAINNPLLYVDPDGEAIQLSNDKDERERQLQALREMVGSNAGAYLYGSQGSDGNWYVGIYDQNPNGDTRSFEQVNEVAGELGAIVRDKEIAVLEFVPRGTLVTDDAGDWARIVEARRGAYRESPAATGYFNGVLKIKMLDWSKHSLGYLPGELMSDRKDNWLTASVMVGHELGHARARMTGYRDRRGNSDAIKGSLRLEDKIRKLQNPNGPRRERH